MTGPPNFSGRSIVILSIPSWSRDSKIIYLQYSRIGFSSTTPSGQYARAIFREISSVVSVIKIAESGFDFDIFIRSVLSYASEGAGLGLGDGDDCVNPNNI